MFADNSQPLTLWDFEDSSPACFSCVKCTTTDAGQDFARLLSSTPRTRIRSGIHQSHLIGTAVLYLDSLSFLLESRNDANHRFEASRWGATIEVIALSIGDIGLVDNFGEFHRNYIGKKLELESG